MNDNKPFGELGVGMKMNINDLNAIYGDYKPIIIDPEKEYSALSKTINSNSVPVDLNI